MVIGFQSFSEKFDAMRALLNGDLTLIHTNTYGEISPFIKCEVLTEDGILSRLASKRFWKIQVRQFVALNPAVIKSDEGFSPPCFDSPLQRSKLAIFVLSRISFLDFLKNGFCRQLRILFKQRTNLIIDKLKRIRAASPPAGSPDFFGFSVLAFASCFWLKNIIRSERNIAISRARDGDPIKTEFGLFPCRFNWGRRLNGVPPQSVLKGADLFEKADGIYRLMNGVDLVCGFSGKNIKGTQSLKRRLGRII